MIAGRDGLKWSSDNLGKKDMCRPSPIPFLETVHQNVILDESVGLLKRITMSPTSWALCLSVENAEAIAMFFEHFGKIPALRSFHRIVTSPSRTLSIPRKSSGQNLILTYSWRMHVQGPDFVESEAWRLKVILCGKRGAEFPLN